MVQYFLHQQYGCMVNNGVSLEIVAQFKLRNSNPGEFTCVTRLSDGATRAPDVILRTGHHGASWQSLRFQDVT